MSLTLGSTVSRKPNLLSTEIGDELVILSMTSNSYVGLDRVGRRVWELIENPIVIADLVVALEGMFEAPEGQIRNDVLVFLEQLATDDLLVL